MKYKNAFIYIIILFISGSCQLNCLENAQLKAKNSLNSENFTILQGCFERMLGDEMSQWDNPVDYNPFDKKKYREMAHITKNEDAFERLRVIFHVIPEGPPPCLELDCLADAYDQLNEMTSGNLDFHVISNLKNDIIYEANLKEMPKGSDQYPHKRIYREVVKDNIAYMIIYMRVSKNFEMSDKDKEMWIERLRNAV